MEKQHDCANCQIDENKAYLISLLHNAENREREAWERIERMRQDPLQRIADAGEVIADDIKDRKIRETRLLKKYQELKSITEEKRGVFKIAQRAYYAINNGKGDEKTHNALEDADSDLGTAKIDLNEFVAKHRVIEELAELEEV